MLKKIKFIFPVIVMILLAACDNGINNSEDIISKLEQREVSVYNGNASSGTVDSYQANVKSYYTNKRIGLDMELQNEYRLSMKIIDGEMYSRIDFNSNSFPDSMTRSLVSNSSESIVLFSDTGVIESRFPIDQTEERFLLDTDDFSTMGRIDIDSLLVEAKRLSFDVNDETPGSLFINVPSSSFTPQSNGQDFVTNVVSCKLSFDTEEDILVSSEMKVVESDGTNIDVLTHPLYQETEGVMIKVGQVQVIDNILPENIINDDSVVQEYASAEDIPEISEQDLFELQALGEVSMEEVPVFFGDQSSSEFQEIFVDLYEDVEVNTLSDSLFKIGLEG